MGKVLFKFTSAYEMDDRKEMSVYLFSLVVTMIYPQGHVSMENEMISTKRQYIILNVLLATKVILSAAHMAFLKGKCSG